MKKIKELEKIVRSILIEKPATRGDDDLLYLCVLDTKGIDLAKVSAESFLLNYRHEGLPTVETVGRCRRKIQAEREDLKPSPDVVLKRKKFENSFYFYSLS